MGINEDRIKTERLFISILLEYKDLVSDWLSGNLKPFYFRKEHQLILSAIKNSFQKGEILTKESFLYFVKQRSKDDATLNAYMFLFDRLTILDESRDNFNLLKDKIIESYVSEYALEYIDDFRKNIKNEGSVLAAR